MTTSTSDVFVSSGIKKGVYVKMPTPALKVLADMRKYTAQRILVALCTYMDIRTHQCWPSYTAIERRAGVTRGNIRKNLDLLVALGFLTITKRQTGGKRNSNFYTITYLGYQEHLWKQELKDWLPYVGICLACGNDLKRGETLTTETGEVFHLRCGGEVHKLAKSVPSRPKKQVENSSFKKGNKHYFLDEGQTLGVEHLKMRKDQSL